ncbi:MAG: HD domain-containing protein [Candidatus Aminicenantes bacterium]|nr:HD domain-containing protein [Candidatus Aminicenantes bacterium]
MKKMQAKFREKEFLIRHFDGDVYAVGGYVRDLIRGIPSEDVDILITHHPVEEIIKKIKSYGKVDLVGKSFGVIKFTINRKTYDIALPRRDMPKESEVRGHKDFIISANPDIPIERDLQRRDFRCNSIALRLIDNTLIDPFGSLEDISAKIIRLTNPKAFPEDPLRVLRAARFASVLNFSIDTEIYDSSKDIDLSGLSVERVNEEIFKILLLSPLPSSGLEELFKLGVLRQLFPELYSLTLSIQDSIFHPEKDLFGHHTVWHHTKLTVDQAKRLADRFHLNQEKKLTLLLAALYHDVGKPGTAQWEYKKGRMVITNNGHDVASEKITKKIFDRFRIFSWNGYNLRKIALSLIRCHHRASELWQNKEIITKKAFNRLAADTDGEIELLVYLDAADRAGREDKPVRGLDEEGTWLLKKFDELNVSKETIKPIIMGRDLLKIGQSAGPSMGRILKKLYQLQLDNEFETKEEGLKIAEKLIKK